MTGWTNEDIATCVKCNADYASVHDYCPVCSQPQSGKTMYTSIDQVIKDVTSMPSKTRGLATVFKIDEPIVVDIVEQSSRSTDRIIRFTILGQPIPKARPRLGKRGYAYTPTKTKKYESLVKEAALLAISEPFESPVFVSLRFYRKGKVKADVDNLCKAVLDGMNKTAYTDDKQVRELFADVQYSDKEPRVDVTICSVDDVEISFDFKSFLGFDLERE